MSKDLQVVRFRETLPISSVSRVAGVSPPALWVIGTDFSSAMSVWINEIKAPEFAVYSRTRLIVQIPDSVLPQDVQRIDVVSGKITLSKQSHVDFDLGPFTTVQGMERVLQTYIKILLQAPGSDMYNPSAGGGVLQLIGRTMGSGGLDGVNAPMARAIDMTARYMIEKQTPIRNLPPAERLLSARLDGIEADIESSSLYVRILLKNMAGDSAAPSFAV